MSLLSELLKLGALVAVTTIQPWALASEAPEPVVSAIRRPGESFEQAMARASLSRLSTEKRRSSMSGPSAKSMAVPLEELNRRLIPSWPGMDAIQAGFERIRDDRFLILPEDPDRPRRISWTYALDGCFARAATASEHLEGMGYRRPAKIFIFGNLGIRTSHSGYVSWWYHVAPVVDHGGRAYVLDPAVEASGPLTVEEWAGRMTRDLAGVTLAICNPFSYTPWSACYVSGPGAESAARRQQLHYVRQDRGQR